MTADEPPVTSSRIVRRISTAAAALVTLLLAVPALASESPPVHAAHPAAATDATGAAPAPGADRGSPVKLEGETLFTVRAALGPFSPRERAEAAEKRLERLAADPFYSPDLLTVQESESAAIVMYGEAAIGFITEADAKPEGLTRAAAAAYAVRKIKDAIAAYHEHRRPAAQLRGWIVLGVSTAVFAAFLYLLARIKRRVLDRIGTMHPGVGASWLERYFRIGIEQVVGFERRVVGFLRAIVAFVVALVYLQVAFTFFPLTRGYALAVLDYVFDPLRTLWHGFLSNISGLFSAVVLVVLARYLLKGLRWLFHEVSEGTVSIPGITREWAIPLYKLLRIVIIGLAIVMIYPYIPGSNTLAFKGVSLFAGALFTLGASGTIGNFIGGLVAIFAGTFRIGDWVTIGDVTGEVLETTLVLTRIRTAREEIVTVPNATILSAQVKNYSIRAREGGVILRSSVTIGYDAPWRTVHDLLVRAASRTTGIERQPAPFVLQASLDDFFVTYWICAYTKEPSKMPLIYGELHQNIQDGFNEAGVEIMSPHFAALRDGNTIAIPEENRRPEGRPRKFEVRIDPPGSEGGRPG